MWKFIKKSILLVLFGLIFGFALQAQIETKIIASDNDTDHQFGYDVALFEDQMIVSAPGNPKTYIYENNGGWNEVFTYVRDDSGYTDPDIIMGTNSKIVDIKNNFAITGGLGVKDYFWADPWHTIATFLSTESSAVMFKKVNGIWEEYYHSSHPYENLWEITAVTIMDTIGIYASFWFDYNVDTHGDGIVFRSDGNAYYGESGSGLGWSLDANDSTYVVASNTKIWIENCDVCILADEQGNFTGEVTIQNDSIIVTTNYAYNKVYVMNHIPHTGQWYTGKILTNNYPSSSNVLFGKALAISNNTIAIGAPGMNNNTGAVYLYSLDHDSNALISETPFMVITASDAWAGMEFGNTLDFDNGRLVVGVKEDNTNGSNSGAVYIYDCLTTSQFDLTNSNYGESSGSINLTVHGGVGPYEFLWNTGETTEDISGLSAGLYYVNIIDQNNCSVTDSIMLLNNPRLQYGEYFFDTDPGNGNGTQLNLSSPSYTIDTIYNINVVNLSVGFHVLYTRFFNENNQWGIAEGRPIYVLADNTYTELDAMEYFFDHDPGVGNGISISVTQNDTINDVFNFDISGLSTGFHQLFIRAKTAVNTWGIAEGRPIYVLADDTYTELDAMEYFFDHDPGVGNGISISVTQNDTINDIFDFDVSDLSTGFHKLYIRAKTAVNTWGIAEGRPIYVLADNTYIEIVGMEYFFNTDPGIGNGTAMAVTQGDTIEDVFGFNISGLTEGEHNLFLRTKTENNIWSIAEGRSFEVIPSTVPTNFVLQNAVINSPQTVCYDATNTITVAGSGTTVVVNSGGEATFIAGNKIIFNPGFTSHLGSYSNAYITTTGDYCSQQPPMMAQTPMETEESLIADAKEMVFEEVDLQREINIYPNPTTGKFIIDFMGKETTANIVLMNFQGNQFCNTDCNNQATKEIDVEYLPSGVYVIVIKAEIQVITKKLIKLNL